MLRLLKKILGSLLTLVLLLVIFTWIYLQRDLFGKTPDTAFQEKMKSEPNYKDGKFQNEHVTPELTEGYSMLEVTWEFIFQKKPRLRPVDTLPSIKTDLLHLRPDENVLIWFGHSSYFIQIDGKKILLDPVFSGNASPVPGTNKSFLGTDIYTVEDLPDIDYLFISHDHYDHTDYETLLKLKAKTGKVICGLGVGEHFRFWGFPSEKIIETNWNKRIVLDSGFIAFSTPARHFSGRGLKRNNTLWLSYVMQTPSMKFYFGGDSGYDTHYAEIGKEFGPIDLVMLDNGQYDEKWKYIHTLPPEVLVAAHDLKAKRLFPVHSSKFAMANHPWDEPLEKISILNQSSADPIPLVTPIIGEIVFLNDSTQKFKQWWRGLN